MSFVVGFGPANVAPSSDGGVADHAQGTSRPADRSLRARAADGGALRRVSLRFVDAGLEQAYQRKGGAESLNGFRVTMGAASTLWLLAAIAVPASTNMALDRVVPVAVSMALLNWSALLFSGMAVTLDRQHFLVAVLTSVNGLVILALAATGGVLPGYGMSAIMLLLLFGFVTRTGFVFASLRSAVIVAGFVVAVVLYRGRGSLDLDVYLFGVAVIVSLLALRRLEQSRRRVFYQDLLINEQAEALKVEKGRANDLLLNMLPASISSRLLAGERTIADGYPAVTVLFADIVGFTSLAAHLPAGDVVSALDRLFARFDDLVAERGLEKIKTIGDAYMAAGGLNQPLDDHAARVVDLGLAMIDVAAQEGRELGDLRLRVGVHSGPVIGGVIGQHKFAFDIWGETVNLASRLESQGVPGRVQVSDKTWRAVEATYQGEARGPIVVRGYGRLETHLILGRRGG